MLDHMDFLADVLNSDMRELREKEAQYEGSWKKRGGIGAWMMLARKWDRLERRVEKPSKIRFDIFDHILTDPRPEGVIDDIRDLRRYLALVECESLRLLKEIEDAKGQDANSNSDTDVRPLSKLGTTEPE